MKKEPKVFVGHILDSINKIIKFTKDQSEVDFSRDEKTQGAVLREFEVIGEATKNLPINFREKHSDVKWRKMTANRDVLIHTYFEVDMSIVWETVKKDLPILKKQITKILKSLN
jgi:uncharacterized protein with HEPN domain